MAQEEHEVKYSYNAVGGGGGGGLSGSGGGGGGDVVNSTSSTSSRSKKVKQKKVPQRGLGVAQLERIRLEEQQKKEALQAANVLASNAIGSPSDTTPCLALQCQDYRTSISPPRPNLVPSPTNLSPADVFFRPPPLMHSSEILHKNSVHMSKQSSDGRGEVRMQAISGCGNWPRLNPEVESQRFDHHGSAFRMQLNLPYESNVPALSFTSVPQRLHQFQQHSSSVVNSSSGITPSSMLSPQMEPPSNQSFSGNNYSFSRSEEDKMFGMKRPYPFSLESPPAPTFHRDFPTYAASRSKSDEFVSCSIGETAHAEERKRHIRAGPSNSSTPSESGHDAKEVNRHDGRVYRDFLKLAPPVASSLPTNVKHSHPSNYSQHREPSQETQICRLGPSGSGELAYSFFPVETQIDQTTTHLGNDKGNGNGEKNEAIDLNLKL